MVQMDFGQRIIVQVQTRSGREYRRSFFSIEDAARYKDQAIHERGYVAAFQAPREIGDQYI